MNSISPIKPPRNLFSSMLLDIYDERITEAEKEIKELNESFWPHPFKLSKAEQKIRRYTIYYGELARMFTHSRRNV